jgi:DNA processing protein
MTATSWQAALRLHLTPGLGLRRSQALLRILGGPEQVLDAPDGLLREALGVRLWSTLRATPAEWQDSVRRVQAWLLAAPAGVCHSVIAWGEPDYPNACAQLPDPPLLLFVSHARELGGGAMWPPSVALVGSRAATPQGLALTRQWAEQLAQAGWCVTSGLAHGIDAAAHWGALRCTAGACVTMAVMGTGPDVVYPSVHAELKSRILLRGVCVTEQLPGTLARRSHFPLRNRLLAALSQGVVVMEADLYSGSIISARCALDQGHEVMAVPGSVRSPLSRGCHALLRQGATLVESAEDVLQTLAALGVTPKMTTEVPTPVQAPAPSGKVTSMSAWELTLCKTMGQDPWSINQLQAELSCAMADLLVGLQRLELQGHVARLPGDRVQWVSPPGTLKNA